MPWGALARPHMQPVWLPLPTGLRPGGKGPQLPLQPKVKKNAWVWALQHGLTPSSLTREIIFEEGAAGHDPLVTKSFQLD